MGLNITTLSWISNGPLSHWLCLKSISMSFSPFKCAFFLDPVLFPMISTSLILASFLPPFILQPSIIWFLSHHYHETEFTETTSNYQIQKTWSVFYKMSPSNSMPLITPSTLKLFFHQLFSGSSISTTLFLPPLSLTFLRCLQSTFFPGVLIHTCDFNFPLYSSDHQNTISSPLTFLGSSPIFLVA